MTCKLIFAPLIACVLVIFPVTIHAQEAKLELSLEDIFVSAKFNNKTINNIQWNKDSSAFSFTKNNPENGLVDIYEYDAVDFSTTLLLAGEKLQYESQVVEIANIQWTGNRNYLLIAGPKTLTWDNVVEGPYYIYSNKTENLRPLVNNNASLRNVHLSPDGNRVGYVLDNNIYITELESGSTIAVTTDGSSNIFNGIFDYGSTMFGFKDAWYWSPDSKKIAFWRLDASIVKVFYMVDELGKYNTVKKLKYPNTGEKHAVNMIGVFDLGSNKTSWMDIGDNPDDYIPLISWTRNSNKLAIQRLTRDHKKLDLLMADTNSGKSEVIHTENDPAWIDITNDLKFFQNKDQFVWTSEKSGFRHAYLYDYKGREKQLTSGDWEISSLIEIDEKAGWLYFYAKKDSFIDQHVYRVKLKGSKVEKLSKKPGWYNWSFSPNKKFVIESYSNARTPPKITLRRSAGRLVMVLEANDLPAMQKYSMSHKEFIQFRTRDGILVDGFIMKPPGFNPEKRYPAIGYGYGNAGSQVVINSWSPRWPSPKLDLWHRYMAEQGYIIFGFDSRTTAGRGKAAKNLTYGHYAKWAIHDYLEGINHLKTLPYIDLSRLGFWGWSGGAYLAAALMTKGAPHFKTAVSVAPVIDLSRYQAVGVERWMGFLEDNPEGYYKTNLINYVDKLQGNLLLIHGTGDENVKFGFTLQFADALIKAGKQFDMMVYPNQHHDIQDYQQHVFRKITNYFLEKL
jgi:dipeptidyl-peptidase-4